MAALSFHTFSVKQVTHILSLQLKIKPIKLTDVIRQVFCRVDVVGCPGLQRGDAHGGGASPEDGGRWCLMLLMFSWISK